MKAMRNAGLALAVAAFGFAGCGDDPDEEFYPQILYRLEARGGGACFRLDYAATGGARHEVEPGRIFVLVEGERGTFLVANGPPPYEARFTWDATTGPGGCPDISGVIDVSGFEVQGTSAEVQTLSAANPAVVVRLRADVPGPVAAEVESKPVRFEVCSPPASDAGCGGGPIGREFTGNIGDAFVSHILSELESNDSATTPAVVFLENARDRVSGIFRGLTDQLLRGELYIDDELVDAQNSTGDVVLDKDL